MEKETEYHKTIIKVTAIKKLACFEKGYVYAEKDIPDFPCFRILTQKREK